MRFLVLFELARDIFAIPIFSVAFEASFSTGVRVLNSFRNSLTPKMVEALVCSKDWLRSCETLVNDEEEHEEGEEEEFQRGKCLIFSLFIRVIFLLCFMFHSSSAHSLQKAASNP
ncbi:Putative AC transposase [Linum perenne]